LEGCASVQGENFYEGKRNITFLKGFLARQKDAKQFTWGATTMKP
jgi:hypothetical protein